MDTIIVLAIAGAIGGLIKSIVEQHGSVVLPSIEVAQDGTKYVHLGGIANLIVGGVVAVLTAITPITALYAGISSAFIIEKLLEKAKASNKTTLLPPI